MAWSQYAFYTDQGARYEVRQIDRQQAADYGVPHADVVLIGKHGELVTRVVKTGKVIRHIPKQGGEGGYRAKFWDSENRPVAGWVAVTSD